MCSMRKGDTFGKGIKDWHIQCKAILEQGADNQILKEHFEKLILHNEGQNSSEDYIIRKLEKTDFEEVKILIKREFPIGLLYRDDDGLENFAKKGYYFVACHNDEILGVVLGYPVPDLSSDTVYIDTFVVAENIRGSGIGKKLLMEVSKQNRTDNIRILRLQTEKTKEAYRIYKHLGFYESSLIHMEKYYF
ncbi:MAG: GNAT family N-acetyltransferase [Lachnospiraceae bacterium]|nr:GNAT family N-acetyltransferase [Lachnospiraceae bacterium]